LFGKQIGRSILIHDRLIIGNNSPKKSSNKTLTVFGTARVFYQLVMYQVICWYPMDKNIVCVFEVFARGFIRYRKPRFFAGCEKFGNNTNRYG